MAGTLSAKSLCQCGMALGLANYILFAIGTSVLGDAINGHISGVRYFLHLDAGFTEVSWFAYRFAEWQSYSLLITFPVALWCAYLCANRRSAGRDASSRDVG